MPAARIAPWALALATMLALPALADAPRVITMGYVAGAGDFACIIRGVGCVQFFVEGGETQATIVGDDDVMPFIGLDACSPDCGHEVSACGSVTITGLHEGNRLTVFVGEVRGMLLCGSLLAEPVKGTVTATFT